MEDRQSCSEYHDQGIVEPLPLDLVRLFDLLFDLVESIADVRLLWRLVDIRVDEAVD